MNSLAPHPLKFPCVRSKEFGQLLGLAEDATVVIFCVTEQLEQRRYESPPVFFIFSRWLNLGRKIVITKICRDPEKDFKIAKFVPLISDHRIGVAH